MAIPLDDLVDASQMCKKYQDLKGCDLVQQKMEDIATSFVSCRADQRSRLCQVVVRDISKHPSAVLLPKADVLELSTNPLYWKLPTDALEALASNYSYRKEVTFWWWQSWETYILSCITLITLFAMGYVSWSWWYERELERRKRTAGAEQQRMVRIKQEKARRICEAQERTEAKRLAELDLQAEIVEQEWIKAEALAKQERLAVEKLAEQQAAAKAAQEAEERKEAANLLKIKFSPSKPKRRKNVPSSQ